MPVRALRDLSDPSNEKTPRKAYPEEIKITCQKTGGQGIGVASEISE